ncbi:MAG: glutathione S-transferase family protein [Devosia sp.]
MDAALTLYTNPMSRGRIARWMLEEVGTPYGVTILDYESGMKSPAYLAINPMGKVPALTHGDRVVTETAAICAYLADAFPEAELAPPLDQRAAYYRWLFFAAGPLESALTAKGIGLVPPADKARQLGYGSIETTLDTMEAHLTTSSFMAGETFTAADVYGGSQLLYGMMFKTVDERPAFTAYKDRLVQRPAFGRANSIDEAAAAGN